jgi:hypothetical protein
MKLKTPDIDFIMELLFLFNIFEVDSLKVFLKFKIILAKELSEDSLIDSKERDLFLQEPLIKPDKLSLNVENKNR